MLHHLAALVILLPVQQISRFEPATQSATQVRIGELQSSMKNGAPKDFAEAARELTAIARELNKGEDIIEASRIAVDIFLSDAPADLRRTAYSIAAERMPHETAKHVIQVRMLGPHTTCWGRFTDAFHDRLLPNNPWVLSVSVRNTHIQRRENALGTVAELEFVIGNQHTTRELVKALVSSGFDVAGWQVFVEVPASSLLKKE
ncbi:MAG: hypothetical protein AB8B50_00010 [Pirellulaceae bacterium]